MEKVTKIQNLYFDQNKTLTEISEIIGLSISYIARILRKDNRYKSEKKKRKQENLLKRRKVQKDLIYQKRQNIIDMAYINMKNQHEQASKELSKNSILGNEMLRKWCSSAYNFNPEKNRYEFNREELLKPADFPMYIKK